VPPVRRRHEQSHERALWQSELALGGLGVVRLRPRAHVADAFVGVGPLHVVCALLIGALEGVAAEEVLRVVYGEMMRMM
jgi:hypothetical protein